MAKIETVYIHHPELDTEAEVPPHTVAGWAAQGWVPGPLDRNQVERDNVEAERFAAAKRNADETAAVQAAADAQAFAEESGVLAPPALAPPADAQADVPSPPVADENQQIADRVRGRETTGATTPTSPEEG